jgi:hypothetical protein
MATTLHHGDRGPAVKRLQVEVNRRLRNRRFPWRTIDPDEIFGDETQRAARFVGWLMGFHGPTELDNIRAGTITAHAFAILVREQSPTKEMKQRDRDRRVIAKKLRFTHNHRPRKIQARGVAAFEGDQVASWMVRFLKMSREKGWDGQLISGFRSPAHSERVCLDMCGQPSCRAGVLVRTAITLDLSIPLARSISLRSPPRSSRRSKLESDHLSVTTCRRQIRTISP